MGVASVAADDAAVPRYRRGCLDALHRPSRHDLSALSTTIRCLPSCRGVPSLSAASSPRSSILDPSARCTLRISFFGCPTHAALRVQGRPSVYGACARPCWPIRREGNGSRERRLMRSRVSLAELFHEIRVSIYENRSRRFLLRNTAYIHYTPKEKIRAEARNKKKTLDSTSVTFILEL